MTKHLTPERERAIRARESAATKGPWRWFGNTKFKSIYLATVNRGRVIIMDFVRWGMEGAQPRFHPQDSGFMVPVSDLVRYEVDYRGEITDINCPDAEFLEHSREDIPQLLAEIDRLRAMVAELEVMVEEVSS